MFTSRPLRATAAVAALVLSLAACGASENEDPTAASDGGGTEVSSPSEDAPAAAADESESADESDDAAGQEAGTVTITLNGEETSFTPEIVRCSGEPGTIRNAVLTMKDDELPLIKVTPGEFAMVKLDNHREPEKTSSLKGITAEDGQITFDDAAIGDATVDGPGQRLQRHQGCSAGTTERRRHRVPGPPALVSPPAGRARALHPSALRPPPAGRARALHPSALRPPPAGLLRAPRPSALRPPPSGLV